MTCAKVRYRDRIAAVLALESTRRGGKPKRAEQRAYRCPACRGWHLTSMKRSGRS